MGNITAGVDLIRRARGVSAHALVTRWSPSRTERSSARASLARCGWTLTRLLPFQFYQFWLNTADADAIRFMKYYTLLALDEIGEF